MFSQCFGMLQVRKNEISLRQWPAGTALLRTSEGTSMWIDLAGAPSPHHRVQEGGSTECWLRQPDDQKVCTRLAHPYWTLLDALKRMRQNGLSKKFVLCASLMYVNVSWGSLVQHRVIMACDLYCCSIVEGFPRVALAAMQQVKPCFWHTENLLGPFNAVHNVLLQHHAFLSIWH